MRKISTLFKKNPEDLSKVINEIDPENNWVFEYGIPTRKFDGTSCAVINGELYKRYDVRLFKRKKGKVIKFTKEQIQSKIPEGAIPCQEPDELSGHWPHWVKCIENNPEDKYHLEAFNSGTFEDGTYELCGEKVQGNPENIDGHMLIKHGSEIITDLGEITFENIKGYLSCMDIEGIVFHHKNDGRMCKIRKVDFGIIR